MLKIMLSALTIVVLLAILFVGGLALAAIAPPLLLMFAFLFTLVILAAGIYQTGGPRPRNYRQEPKPTDTSVGVLGTIGGLRLPFFYNQKLPAAPPPRRKTARRKRALHTTTAGARGTKPRDKA